VSFWSVGKISISPLEFIWKMAVSLFVIMPICIGGAAFGFYQVATNLQSNIPVITSVGAFIGTVLGFIGTICLVKIGHKEE
jgi:ABC-type uncharacterized transport system permease subunit